MSEGGWTGEMRVSCLSVSECRVSECRACRRCRGCRTCLTAGPVSLSPDCRGVGRCRALSGHCRATVGLIDLTLMSSVGACCRGLSGAVGGSLTVTMCVHCRAVSGCVGPVGPVGPVGVSGCRVLSGTVGCQAKHMSVSSTEHHSSTVSHRRCLPGPTAQH